VQVRGYEANGLFLSASDVVIRDSDIRSFEGDAIRVVGGALNIDQSRIEARGFTEVSFGSGFQKFVTSYDAIDAGSSSDTTLTVNNSVLSTGDIRYYAKAFRHSNDTLSGSGNKVLNDFSRRRICENEGIASRGVIRGTVDATFEDGSILVQEFQCR
jgi:hypothetical protein